MKIKFLLFLGLIISSFALKAQTTIPALITSNQVWTISGSPYLLGQNSYIDSGVSVIVMPGVEIKSSGTYRMDVHGEFQGRGKWDSVITISKIQFKFSAKSRDYDPTTGRGAYFNYCNIEGNGSGYTTMELTSTAIKIDHCAFTNSYYSLFIQSGFPQQTVLAELTNSDFAGDSYGGGTAIYCTSLNSKLRVTNCVFHHTSSIYTYGNVVFTNNTFFKMRNISFGYLSGINEISCNRFNNIIEGVILDANGNIKTNLTFNNNTLDSFGSSTSSYPMLTLKRKSSSSGIKDSIEIRDNNFLSRKGSAAKLTINATNYTPTKTDTVNLQYNYWGSTDSATIEGLIRDYKDDINIYGRVDFSNFKSIPVIGCSYNGGCAIANFNYSISDTTVTFHDTSFSTKPYKVKWKFGDGSINDSNQHTIVHEYHQGIYMVCMYTYDSLNNLCDSICKVVQVFGNTTCHASYYFAIDTNDLTVVYVVNTSTGVNAMTKYYWTFGDGTGSTAKNPIHTYLNDGKYQLCVTIFDTLFHCYSTYCDSVEISSGTMLRVLDGNQVQKIEKQDVFSSIAVFPNPSKGDIKISLGSLKPSEVAIEVMDASGKIIKSENINTKTGINEISLDLGEYENGLYCINIRSGDYSKTVKLIIGK